MKLIIKLIKLTVKLSETLKSVQLEHDDSRRLRDIWRRNKNVWFLAGESWILVVSFRKRWENTLGLRAEETWRRSVGAKSPPVRSLKRKASENKEADNKSGTVLMCCEGVFLLAARSTWSKQTIAANLRLFMCAALSRIRTSPVLRSSSDSFAVCVFFLSHYLIHTRPSWPHVITAEGPRCGCQQPNVWLQSADQMKTW